MQTQIKAWGNSQAIRISKEMLEMAGMKLNDIIDIEAGDGKIIIYKKPRHMTLEERASEYGGKLNIGDIELEYGDPVGRELW